MNGEAPCYIPEGEEYKWRGTEIGAPCYLPDEPDVQALRRENALKSAATVKKRKAAARKKAKKAQAKLPKAEAEYLEATVGEV